MENWQKHTGDYGELVLSSRIRVARNLTEKPFPHNLNEEEGRNLVKTVEDAFYKSSYMENNFNTIYLWQNNDILNYSYLEKHLISPGLINNKSKAAFILGEDETVSIMINEEDHIRLQCISAGFQIRDCYNKSNNLDNLLDEGLDYVFDEKLGYITACPTNLGTGLRASVMIHLPALTVNNGMNEILKALTQVGMTIRGLYGEGSKVQGNIYQISNQITLGVSEEDIITNLEAVVSQVINQENRTREQLIKKFKYELEDKVFRSVGILENAIVLNNSECMELLSNVRMGIEMGIIKDIDKSVINNLLIDTQPASIQRKFSTVFNDKERDINRARVVRDAIRAKNN